MRVITKIQCSPKNALILLIRYIINFYDPRFLEIVAQKVINAYCQKLSIPAAQKGFCLGEETITLKISENNYLEAAFGSSQFR